MNKLFNILLTICILVLLAWFASTQWSIVSKSYVAEHEALLNAKQQIKIDTVIMRDTVTVAGTSKPVLIHVIDTCWLPSNIDSLQLLEIAKQCAQVNIFHDSIVIEDMLHLNIDDVISHNMIQERSWNLNFIKIDTIIKTDIQHIVDMSIKPKRNMLQATFGIGNAHSALSYDAMYFRILSKPANKLQFGLGAGFGKLKFDCQTSDALKHESALAVKLGVNVMW